MKFKNLLLNIIQCIMSVRKLINIYKMGCFYLLFYAVCVELHLYKMRFALLPAILFQIALKMFQLSERR